MIGAEVSSTKTFLNGRIKVKQRKNGYRFSLDAVLLADYVSPGPKERVVDLGTGCGIIPLIMAHKNPDISVVGVEIQKSLAETATYNIAANNMEDRVIILCRDFRGICKKDVLGPVDIVVCNPPFRKVSAGRINPDKERAIAMHEIRATVNDVVKAAKSILKPAGKLIMIYPAERITDILSGMRSFNIEPKSLIIIHSGFDKKANRIIVKGRKGGGPGIRIEPPLIVWNNDGTYTDRIKRIFDM